MKKFLALLVAALMITACLPVASMADAPVKLTWFEDVPSFSFNSEG